MNSVGEAVSDERREYTRAPFIQKVQVDGLGTLRCSDISLRGMYLESLAIIPVDTTIGIHFKLPNEHIVNVKARVLYIHEGLGMGLEFVNFPSDDLERIKKFIKEQ